MDSKIKNLVFDLGGVLINLDFDGCLNAFRKAGFTDIDKQVHQFRGEGFFSEFELGDITPEAFRETIRCKINSTLTDSEIDDMWNLMLLDIPREKLDLLLTLRQHYTIFLLSNTNQIHWDFIREQKFNYHGFDVNDFFEATFLSFEMHKAKPEKEIYQQMMEDTQIVADETFFIDDSEANCKAAASLGIHTHHYRIGEDLRLLVE